ncbi:MAG: hypothetical protein F6K41_42655, partial [Symploca sp. SIO3E6]|nr:hypothetical protein [Caldora sp. SIO3E6]
YFGAVKQLRLGSVVSGQVSMTVAIGTLDYMPTEQAGGKPRLSSDLYALGKVSIQALTGLLPTQLREDKDGELIWRSLADVSDELADILSKMVHYHFRERYQTATEVLQALPQLRNPYTPTQVVAGGGYTPTQAVAPKPPPTFIPLRVNTPSEEPTQPVSPTPTPPTPVKSTRSQLPIMIGIGLAVIAFVSGMMGIGFALVRAYQTDTPNQQTTPNITTNEDNLGESATKPKEEPQPEGCFADVRGNIRSEPASWKNNIIDVGKWLPVTGKQTPGGWIEVELSSGNKGWAHRTIISNDGEIDSCLQKNGIRIETASDIPRPLPKPNKDSSRTNGGHSSGTNGGHSSGTDGGHSSGTDGGSSSGTESALDKEIEQCIKDHLAGSIIDEGKARALCLL